MSESDTPDMKTAIDSGDYDSAGLEFDQGLNLHDWVTRWAEIEELYDDPDSVEDGLTAAAELLERMMAEMGQRTSDPAMPTTEDDPKDLEVIRDAAGRLAREEPVDPDELDYAVQRSRALFDALAGDDTSREAF